MILVLVGNDRSYIETASKILEITNNYKIKTEEELDFKDSKEKSILILNYSELEGYKRRHYQSDLTDFIIELRESGNNEHKPSRHVDFIFAYRDVVDVVTFLNELHEEVQQTYEYYQEFKNQYKLEEEQKFEFSS